MVPIGAHVAIDLNAKTQPTMVSKLLAVCRGMRDMLGPVYHRDNTTVTNKQLSGAQKPRLDLLVAYWSLVVTYVSLAVTLLG